MKMRAIDKIARAYKNGSGTRLSADEVIDLVEGDTAMQDAVANINEPDDEEEEKL